MTRLYIVDDHELVRDGLRAMVEAGGHTVVGVHDEPLGALRELIALAPGSLPELLLLDLQLASGSSGLDLLTEIGRHALPLRTLVLTISAKPQDVGMAMQLGAAGYLLKHSSRADLLAAIATVMAGQNYLGRDVGELAVRALQGEPADDPLAALSPRERQVLSMVVRGQSSPSIGQLLHLSPNTVDTYRSRLMTKLGLDDLPALVRFAIRAGVIDADGN